MEIAKSIGRWLAHIWLIPKYIQMAGIRRRINRLKELPKVQPGGYCQRCRNLMVEYLLCETTSAEETFVELHCLSCETCTVVLKETRHMIDRLAAEPPITRAEADKLLSEAEEWPVSDVEIEAIVKRVTGK